MDGIEKRTLNMAWYIIENQVTVRELAEIFRVSKTTVHNDLTKRLPKISLPMAQAVSDILAFNLKERSIRGGNATKEKYRLMRESNSMQ